MSVSRIAARSGKAAAPKPAPVTVVLRFDDDDVEEVVVDRSTLTFAEVHEVRKALARLTVRDADGRVVVEPDLDMQVLAHAWVVLRRRRPIEWDDLLSSLPVDAMSLDADVVEDDSPEV